MWGTQGCTQGLLVSNLDREEAAEIHLPLFCSGLVVQRHCLEFPPRLERAVLFLHIRDTQNNPVHGILEWFELEGP